LLGTKRTEQKTIEEENGVGILNLILSLRTRDAGLLLLLLLRMTIGAVAETGRSFSIRV
jgi:hypothetical protein